MCWMCLLVQIDCVIRICYSIMQLGCCNQICSYQTISSFTVEIVRKSCTGLDSERVFWLANWLKLHFRLRNIDFELIGAFALWRVR